MVAEGPAGRDASAGHGAERGREARRAREGAGPRSALARQRLRSAALFLAPMLLVLALVAVEPLGRSIWLSLTDAKLDNLAGAFVGLENYFGEYGLFMTGEGWIDPAWARAVGNTLLFAFSSVVIETVLAFGVALMLNTEFRGRGLVTAAVLVPWAVPTVVSAKLWDWMLQQQYGIVNVALAGAGFERIAFTTEYPMLSVLAVDVWKTTPFMALLILSALKMLPRDCYEAAEVDGVHPLRVFLQVTLPLVRPALMVAVIFRLLDALRVFDVIHVLTGSSENTISMSGFVRQQMVENGSVGFGSAASTVLFLVIGACTLLYMKINRVRAEG
ncbi:carbohydrate ABC transporter permease [Pseudoduganella namucuonensis]|uniref:Trehalose/maltose transport system permease protein n=1 Tax=Pseudoduganella namucuonensis TaxID=1035707 RepID=A0A1I7IYW0_9BURK|nr:sugar ABC transporter permease [Pseudoduganella namucuonensis]SFU78146.1 trehalose/maltose transport system permease protein [Pseudoduganella namucuonensis]